MSNNETPRRTLRREQVLSKTGLSRTAQYLLEKEGDFPKKFMLTPRCAVWFEDEIDAWIKDKCKQAIQATTGPDVRLRKTNPVKGAAPTTVKNPENSTSAETIRTACETVFACMQESMQAIDIAFKKSGYSEEHPELVAAFTQAAVALLVKQ